MTTPASGLITLKSVKDEFGIADPVTLTKCYGLAAGIPASGLITLANLYNKSAAGSAVYTSSATFTVPAGITSICFVAIAMGRGGRWDVNQTRAGGGGSLGYKNAVAVTPGQAISVEITANYSRVNVAGTWYTANTGDAFGNGGVLGSGWTGGGNGGAGTTNTAASGPGYLMGGGGAGGYAGNGGNGGNAAGGLTPATAGSGGGGGGGAGSGGTASSPTLYDRGGGGGGTGLFGIGGNGAAGPVSSVNGGGGGSNGSAGATGTYGYSDYNPGRTDGNGGGYGGGGGAGGSSSLTSAGGPGAVRFIWGAGRSFPSAAS